jgi:hypothetical protein
MLNRWTFYFSFLLWALILWAVSAAAAWAGPDDAPTNVAAVRSGTEIAVTWQIAEDPVDGFGVFVGSTNYTKGAALPPSARSLVLTNQPAAGDVCGITVLARYNPTLGVPNKRSAAVCATESEPEPEPEPGYLESVVVRWTAPTSRVDGSALPLDKIAGYELFFGLTEQVSEGPVFVPSSGSSGTVTLELSPGSWFIAARTKDTGGLFSDLSVPITHQVTEPEPEPVAPSPPVLEEM